MLVKTQKQPLFNFYLFEFVGSGQQVKPIFERWIHCCMAGCGEDIFCICGHRLICCHCALLNILNRKLSIKLKIFPCMISPDFSLMCRGWVMLLADFYKCSLSYFLIIYSKTLLWSDSDYFINLYHRRYLSLFNRILVLKSYISQEPVKLLILSRWVNILWHLQPRLHIRVKISTSAALVAIKYTYQDHISTLSLLQHPL